MKNFSAIAIIALVLIALGLIAIKILPTDNTNSEIELPSPLDATADHKNIEYTIAGARVRLVDGVSETESAPGSASKTVTKYFGNEVWKDLNGDGEEDAAFLITQETGGTGTFYYAVAAVQTAQGYRGSQALLIGDRIAPQTTESGPGNSIIINYADRFPGESFATPPSYGKSLRLLLDPITMQFGEVAQNFEGEADAASMSLTMKKWDWIKASYSDGKIVTPKVPNVFTLTFTEEGSFSATTDCNGVGGSYKTSGSALMLKDMVSTLMYCEGSQESEFSQLMSESETYHFTDKGELILELKNGGGSVTFR